MQTRTVLFVAYGAGHINMLLPVILACRERQDLEPVVMALTTAVESARRHGLASVGFADLVREGDEEALQMGVALAEELGPAARIDPRETIAYLGLSYMDLVRRIGREAAAARYTQMGRAAFLPISVMERAFERFRPALIVATNSPRAEQAALLLARERAIPSVCIVDLFDPRAFEDRLAHPGYGTRICVYFDAVRRRLVTMGRPADEIVVTGNPDFDRLADPGLVQAGAEYRARVCGAHKHVILWARQADPKEGDLYDRVESALLDAASTRSNWCLVVRPHPNDPDPERRLSGSAVLSRPDEPLGVVLHACDIVVTATSTVGLQGVALGKPMVTANWAQAAERAPFAELGLAIGASSVEVLVDLVDQALVTPPPPLPLPPLGGATQRVIRVMDELLTDGQTTA